MTTNKKKAAKKIVARATAAKKAAKKARKKATAAQQLSPKKARALIQETRQELRRLKDDMMDPVFVAKVRRQNDPELKNRLGNVLFDLIDLHETLSNAVLDSILQELRENEKVLRTGISQVDVARRNLSKVKKVFQAADKFLAAVTSVVKAIV